jgi:hypothetical protein
MAEEQRPEEVQRWTAKRRAALIVSLLKGETTAAEAAQRQGYRRMSSGNSRTARPEKQDFASNVRIADTRAP